MLVASLANVAVSFSCDIEGTYLAYSSDYDVVYEVSTTTTSPKNIEATCKAPMNSGMACSWETATCVDTNIFGFDTKLTCNFVHKDGSKKLDNATVDFDCEHIKWFTSAEGSIEWVKHTPSPPPMSCHAFINNVSCNGCPGGCDTPNNCIACAWNYREEGGRHDGNQPVLSSCPGNNAEIRAVCNATVGRTTSPIIKTQTGMLQGFIDVDSSHAVYRGIPFAAPPVKDLRWRPPQPAKPWEGIRNASDFGSTCPQLGPQWGSIGGVPTASEDCLYLNVYAPKKTIPTTTTTATTNTSGLPVMVYYPAGQFMWGSANDAENWIAPQTPAGENVIVVTGNYRLGALGFLALDALRSRDPNNSTGNYGSQDQRQVLIWIKANIAAFGGDPNNVVLWGESAGAAAVTAHLSMPKSFPYFSKAIMESGAFNPWSYRTYSDATENSAAFAKWTGCHNDSSGPIDIECLLNTNASTLVYHEDDGGGSAHCTTHRFQNGSEIIRFNETMPHMDTIDKSLWAPVIDGVELSGIPSELMKQGKSAQVPILLGTNRDEGSTFTGNQTGYGDGEFTADSFYYHWLYSPEQAGGYPGAIQTESQFTAWAAQMFDEDVATDLAKLYAPMTTQTGDVSPPPVNWWWSIAQVIGDFVLTCPARRAATAYANHGQPAFMYHFSHTPERSINQDNTQLYGAFHGSEVPFVFYDQFELNAQEQNLSMAMVQYWVNFAWNGDPNIAPPNQANPPTLPKFPRFDVTDDMYAVLGDLPMTHSEIVRSGLKGLGSNVTIVSHLKKVRCDYWDTLALEK